MNLPMAPLKVLTIASLALMGTSFSAQTSERSYFKTVAGKWHGSGKIVAGPYKDTRFTCKLSGDSLTGSNMKLAGTCRVGLFSQPIEATVMKKRGVFLGKFLDGEKGKGMDITSGRLRGKQLVLNIKRKQLIGTMVANLKNRNSLNITISVRVNGSLVPFIGLTLARS